MTLRSDRALLRAVAAMVFAGQRAARRRVVSAAAPRTAAGFPLQEVRALPQALRQRVIEAALAAEREIVGRMSSIELDRARAERKRELEEMLATGDWGHAIREAYAGDPVLFAFLVSMRVPQELRSFVEATIIAAPWKDIRGRGRPRALTPSQELALCNSYTLCAPTPSRGPLLAFDGRWCSSTQEVIDLLARRYRISESAVRRTLRKHGIAVQAVKNRRF